MAKLVVCPHEEPGRDPCEFQIQSENEGEVVEFVQRHAHEQHDLALSEVDVADMIRDV